MLLLWGALVGRPAACAAEERAAPRQVLRVMPLAWPQPMRAPILNQRLGLPPDGNPTLGLRIERDGFITAAHSASGATSTEYMETCSDCTLSEFSNIMFTALRAVLRKHREHFPKAAREEARLSRVTWPKALTQDGVIQQIITAVPEGVQALAGEDRCDDIECWETEAPRAAQRKEWLLGVVIQPNAVELRMWAPGRVGLLTTRADCTGECHFNELIPLVAQAVGAALKKLPQPPPKPISPGWPAVAWAATGVGLAATLTLFGLDQASPNSLAFLRADPTRCGYLNDADARMAGLGCRANLWPAGIGAAVATASAATAAILLTFRLSTERHAIAVYERGEAVP